jgi:hypothetical protein
MAPSSPSSRGLLHHEATGLLALVVATCVAAGCHDQCGPSRCDGATLKSCSLSGNDAGRIASWQSTPCSGACVADKASGGAFCATSATPIPECQKDGDICYHGAAATCRAGYLERSKPCSGACVLDADSAFCAESSGPVPECQQNGLACVHGAIGTCRAGYLESSKACATGSTCAAAGSCGPLCVLDATPDASCPPPTGADQTSSYCSGNTQVACRCGYTVARVDCLSDFCVAMDGDTRCVLSAATDPRCGDPPPAASDFCDANTAWSCWHGYPISTQACGSTGTCVIDNGLGGCFYHAM